MLKLGLDTGGTYTDAVLMDGDAVIASAKALTTHGTLEGGLDEAVGTVLERSGIAPDRIGLVGISTTLATNALVEGRGGRASLVTIGMSERDLERAEFGAHGADMVHLALAGGHDSHGQEREPLDLVTLQDAIRQGRFDGTQAVAVAGLFAVRNPDHEKRVAERLRDAGLAVTSSHELSPALGGPRRALTAWLNARLLPLVADLLAACDAMLVRRGVGVSAMVVRGDGSLMTRSFAERFPVETILSGPAASLVGAAHLAGVPDATVCDVGGTTSDLGLIRAGRPVTSDHGASVGPHRTMVRAVAMRTHGLGGDSQAHPPEHSDLPWTLGPRRRVPLSLAAREHSAIRERLLGMKRQERIDRDDLAFGWRVGHAPPDEEGLALLARFDAEARPMGRVLRGARERGLAERLASRGFLRIAAFTPSDAAHVLGFHDGWDAEAARLGAEGLARVKDRHGRPLAANADALARAVLAAMHDALARHLLAHALLADGDDPDWANHPMIAHAMRASEDPMGTRDTVFRIGLSRPVIGLGASAHLHVTEAFSRFGGEAVVPDHAPVANAVGAVVGVVAQEVRVAVVAPAPDRLRVEGATFASERDAIDFARRIAHERAAEAARAAGAPDPAVEVETVVQAPEVDGARTFLEAVVIARATGRPAAAAAPDGSTRSPNGCYPNEGRPGTQS